jgi:hypothetical protein
MKHKYVAILAQVVLASSIAMVSVGTMNRAAQPVGESMIPKAFVDGYARTHESGATQTAVEWDETLAPQVRALDITLPGGTMTFGEALKLRTGMSDETPTQYLKYLSEVASVRAYVEGLVRQWNRVSAELTARQKLEEARHQRQGTRSPSEADGVMSPTSRPHTVAGIVEQFLRLEGTSFTAEPPRTAQDIDFSASLAGR